MTLASHRPNDAGAYSGQPYPYYKPSGVEWLGDVPSHWSVVPNRAVFSEINDQDHPGEQMLSVTISEGVIRQQVLLQDTSKRDSSRIDKSAYKLVRPGDFAYNKMRAWQGAIGASRYQGIVSPAYVVQRPLDGANPLYFHHLLRTPAFAKEAERWSYGIVSDMWSLRPEHFKMIHCCVPPPDEQRAIVRYLDHVDARIRRYIVAKEKLIALLEEERQAVIHRAVTRGLDPNVPLNPSGIDWLGDIPAHWDGMALKRLGSFKSGTGFPIEQQGKEEEEVPFYKVSDMNLPANDKLMIAWNNAVSRSTALALKATIFPSGTIIFPKVDEQFELGQPLLEVEQPPGQTTQSAQRSSIRRHGTGAVCGRHRGVASSCLRIGRMSEREGGKCPIYIILEGSRVGACSV